jgi:hypothetical protein
MCAFGPNYRLQRRKPHFKRKRISAETISFGSRGIQKQYSHR